MDSETEVVEFTHTIVSPRDIASGMATGITSPRDLASGSPCHAGATAEGHLPWNLPQPDSKHIIAILIGL